MMDASGAAAAAGSPSAAARLARMPGRAKLRAAALERVSPFLPVFVLSLIVPTYFFVGPLRLSPYLLLLVASFVPLGVYWLTGRAGPIRLPDLLMLGATLWSAMTLLVHHGLAGIEPAGIVLLEMFGAYLVGRCLVRGPRATRVVAYTFLATLLIMLPFAIYESVTGEALYNQLLAKLGPVPSLADQEPRLGLHRVQAAFQHPIAYGLYSSSLLALLFLIAERPFLRAAGVAAVTASVFVSLSTGALLCWVIQAGLLSWRRLFRAMAGRWKLLGGLVVLGYVTVDLLSNRTPFHVFVSYLTLNSTTAYNRIHIWRNGSAEVLNHPLLGIGQTDWERPDWMLPSVDMYWLLIAMRHGLPAVAMLGGACILLLYRAGTTRTDDPATRRMATGLVMGLIAFFTAIWSVHVWDAVACWMMLLIGSLAWFADAGAGPGTTRQRPADGGASGRAVAAHSLQVPRPRGRSVLIGAVERSRQTARH